MVERRGWSVLGGVLWIFSSTVGAQGRIEVGTPAVTGRHLRPYTNAWTVTMEKPGEPPVTAAIWKDALEEITFEGQPALRRTQAAHYIKKDIDLTFVNIFKAETMEPLSADYSRSDTGDSRHLDFRSKTVQYRHTVAKDQAPENSTVDLDRPVFDFYDGMYGLLISTLPLAEGYSGEIPAFDTKKMAIDWVKVHVLREETVAAGPGKSAKTWVVETPTGDYGRMTWWVTREAPYVIKAVLEIPKEEGVSGQIVATLSYTMI